MLVSLHEKAGANLCIFHKTRIYINDIKEHSAYLHKYWFNFQNCTGTLFGIYKLYYRLLYMYSHREVTKSSYHNMVGNRPRTVQVNCTLLQHFIDIIWTQICDIYYLVSTRYILKIQDTTTMVGVHANIALKKFLAFNDEFFGHFSNGKPIHFKWLQVHRSWLRISNKRFLY